MQGFSGVRCKGCGVHGQGQRHTSCLVIFQEPLDVLEMINGLGLTERATVLYLLGNALNNFISQNISDKEQFIDVRIYILCV